MAVDTGLKYRGYNSYALQAKEELYSDTYEVAAGEVMCYQFVGIGSGRQILLNVHYYNADNKKITGIPSTVMVEIMTGVWADYYTIATAPTGAVKAQWSLKNNANSGVINVALPKAANGDKPTAFNDETTRRDAFMTAEGLYVSQISADQIIAGIMMALNGGAWFDLEKPEIVMQSKDGQVIWRASPNNPLSIEDAEGNLLAGIDMINGEYAFVSQIITGEAGATNGYAKIGTHPNNWKGIQFIKDDKDYMLLFDNNGGVLLYVNGVRRQWWGANGESGLFGKTGAFKFIIHETGDFEYLDNDLNRLLSIYNSGDVVVWQNGSHIRMHINPDGNTFMQCGTTQHAIGVDNTGPYRVKNGTKTYF